VNTNLCALILFPVQLMFLYIIETLRQTFDFGTGLYAVFRPVLFVARVFTFSHFYPCQIFGVQAMAQTSLTQILDKG
jgi:hypothetical protein